MNEETKQACPHNLHILGPDDIIPHATELAALREANALNIAMAEARRKHANDPHYPWSMAVVEARAGGSEPEAAPTAELKPVLFSELLAAFDDALNQNPFLWIEIGYTRPTDWMVHVWDRTRKTAGDSTIITTQSDNRNLAFYEATQKLRAYLERGGS